MPKFSHQVVQFAESRRERSAVRDRRARSSDRERSHVHLSGVSVEVDKEESVSLKDSVLNGSSVSLDENTPLLH